MHVVFGHSAKGSLRAAVLAARRDEAVLEFPDDLSCGPIDSEAPSARAAWWAHFSDGGLEAEANLRQFWDRVASTDDHIVVWFSRHSAPELSFFLAWTDRVGERPYDVVDITGRRLFLNRLDGTTVLASLPSVSIMPAYALQSLFGTERPITAQVREQSRQHWRRLRSENAPFRVVTDTGLVSAHVSYFDRLLLAQATPEWQPIAQLVSSTLVLNSDQYQQVGNVMLHARLVSLVAKGKLLVDGDPRDYETRIRLPG
jgi:hypothetical protein